jgi:RNA polymerase sigma factor (sigma-70 family)
MAYRDDVFYIDRVLHHGDAGAFASLVNKHKTMAYNIALRITRSREDAEEVAQDSFVKLYHALHQFQRNAKFTTWFYRVVYNLALTKIRKKSLVDGSVDDEYFEETPDPGIPDALDRISDRDRNTAVQHAINSLAESDQLLVTLYYMDSLPVDEIAEITGLTESNVKVKLFRARKKMQETLESHLKSELHSIL